MSIRTELPKEVIGMASNPLERVSDTPSHDGASELVDLRLHFAELVEADYVSDLR